MNCLITEAYCFIDDCNLTYAFCGGYALELFAGASYRSHSDIDVTLLHEDKERIIDYIINKGWNIYEHVHSENCLRRIKNAADDDIQNCLYVWAIKPGCSLIRVQSAPNENNCYPFEITDSQQREFEFIDIIFNLNEGDKFVCSAKGNITREISKAILHHERIPYLAPEIILFFISNPAYVESDYHRAKTNLDYKVIPPLLPEESLKWLIDSIEEEYPQGNKRLDYLWRLRSTF